MFRLTSADVTWFLYAIRGTGRAAAGAEVGGPAAAAGAATIDDIDADMSKEGGTVGGIGGSKSLRLEMTANEKRMSYFPEGTTPKEIREPKNVINCLLYVVNLIGSLFSKIAH